jgi:hypothetical protein
VGHDVDMEVDDRLRHTAVLEQVEIVAHGL